MLGHRTDGRLVSQTMDDRVIDVLCQILNDKKDDRLDSLVRDIRGKSSWYTITDNDEPVVWGI